tara:strand:+ start:464 stop:1360 length:897 start_codon:yes stop_codon:yes gene_type:complete
MSHSNRIIVLLGPTASGKTATALHMAQKENGVIINCDALQCYADLAIVTARPTPEEMHQAPHRQFGVWDARDMGNAKRWQEEVIPQIHAVQAAGQVPILVGGTGMYVKGLYEGLAHLPELDEGVRGQVAALSGEQAWHALQQEDAVMAAQLEPADTQRVKRALEVMRSTGASLSEWQSHPADTPFDPAQFTYYAMQMARETLYAKINHRVEHMWDQGAVEEVAALAQQFTPEELASGRFPLLKAIGVPEILAYQAGELTRDEAIATMQRNTRRYAKRQMTWIRGQVERLTWLESPASS